MLSIDWHLIFTIGIPESLLMVLMGFQLYNLRVRYGDALAIATISAILSYFVRRLPIVFGLHTLIGVVVLFFLSWAFTRCSFKKVFYAVLTGFAVLGVVQSILLPVSLALASFDYEFAKLHPGVDSLLFLIQAMALGIAYLYFKQYRIFIIDMSDGDE